MVSPHVYASRGGGGEAARASHSGKSSCRGASFQASLGAPARPVDQHQPNQPRAPPRGLPPVRERLESDWRVYSVVVGGLGLLYVNGLCVICRGLWTVSHIIAPIDYLGGFSNCTPLMNCHQRSLTGFCR